MEISVDDAVRLISTTLSSEAHVENEAFIFDGRRNTLAPVPVTDIEQIVNELSQHKEINEACVVTPGSYEVLVQFGGKSAWGPRQPGEEFRLEDARSGLAYELGPASAPFTIRLISKMQERIGPRWRRAFWMPIPGNRHPSDPLDTLMIFRRASRARTLRVVSSTPRSEASWKPFVDAFFFHVGYNLDVAVMPQLSLDHLFESSKISRVRRSSVDELDGPRRQYVADLVHHYQLGVSADSPMLQYLSYYHVAEHWFENIFQEDLTEQIQNIITSPGFSYRRKQDVRQLIRRISKAVQLRDDELVINEQAALRLTLRRYVNLAQLVDDLNHFEPKLVPRYANEVVGFSAGDTVDLAARNTEEVFGALGRRIYKTRNALVHSKEGAKGRFIPFSHDAELVAEVPLMRFIAEQVIVATSKLLP
ncbi:hypothetical protein [Micromonospora sp. NPDC004704]